MAGAAARPAGVTTRLMAGRTGTTPTTPRVNAVEVVSAVGPGGGDVAYADARLLARPCLDVKVLLDSGAAVNIVGEKLATRLEEQHAVQRRYAPGEIETVGGRRQAYSHKVKFTLVFESTAQQCSLDYVVLPGEGENIIVGWAAVRDQGLLRCLPTPLDLGPYQDQIGRAATARVGEPEENEEPREGDEFPYISDDVDIHALFAEEELEEGNALDGPELHGSLQLRQQIAGLIRDCPRLFSPDLEPGGALLPPLHLQLVSEEAREQLRYTPPRDLRGPVRERVRQLLEEAQQQGHLRRVYGATHAVPLVVAKKPGSKPPPGVDLPCDVRVCMDLRAINKITKPFAGTTESAWELLQLVGEQRWRVFGLCDLVKGYNQQPLTEDAKELLVASTPDGTMRAETQPFGLKQSAQAFQEAMRLVLGDLYGTACLCYIDDLLVGGTDEPDFLRNLALVFRRLDDHLLRLHKGKCVLGASSVRFLGHIVSGDGISVPESRLQALWDMDIPTNLTSLRRWIGVVNYLRRFIPGCSSKLRDLTKLCSTRTEFRWGAEQQTAFDEVRATLRELRPLYFPVDDVELVLQTDASNVGVAGVLRQTVDGQDRLIACVSKALNEVEARWSTIELECYAIVFAVHKLRLFLQGRTFIIESDHRNLQWMHNSSNAKVRRWMLLLSEYDFVVRHIAGAANVLADGWSRSCRVVRAGPAADAAARELSLEVIDNIARAHNGIVGHFGVDETLTHLDLLGQQWEGRREDVRFFIATCGQCEKNRPEAAATAAPALRLRTTVASEPFQVIVLDHVGPLPEAQGFKYILAIKCAFTRVVWLFPTVSTTAEESTAMLANVLVFGLPQVVRTDGATSFTARIFNDYLRALGITHEVTIAHRPQSNGIIERGNREVLRHLRALTFERPETPWPSLLPIVALICNSARHSGIGMTPLALLFGGRATPWRGLLSPFPAPRDAESLSDYVAELDQVRAQLIDQAQAHQADEVARRLQHSPAESERFDVGDLVLLVPVQHRHKLQPRLLGPYVVVRQVDEHDLYEIAYLDRDDTTVVIHASRLRQYLQRGRGRDAMEPAQVAARDADAYLVAEVLEHGFFDEDMVPIEEDAPHTKDNLFFLVIWQGYDDPTWEAYYPSGLDENVFVHSYISEFGVADPYLRHLFPRRR